MRRRPLLALLAALLAAGAAAIGVLGALGPGAGRAAPAAAAPGDVTAAAGRDLYVQNGCAGCHGMDGRGVPGSGPTLFGAGAAAADFYLSTGRMPLRGQPGDQPLRARPALGPREIAAVTAYVGTLCDARGCGPPVPRPDPARGDVARGQELFTRSCAGCHQILGEGGLAVGALAPPLHDSTPTQIAEAIRVGPYVMPAFGPGLISDRQVDDIVRYVQQVVKDPPDDGGWGIGHIGPVPEGMVAWLMGLAALLIVARLIGERTT